MNETRDLLERIGERFTFPDDMFERLERRRDRKRRNKRIAAGVVGIAVFVAAVWIVTTGGSFNRTQQPAVQPTPTPPAGIIAPETTGYLIDLTTGERTPLPKSTAGGFLYAVSPDGTMVAYFSEDDAGTPQVFIASLDGTDVQQVTHDKRGAWAPDWSPDGAAIAYTSGGYALEDGDVSNIFVLDLATGETSQVTNQKPTTEACCGRPLGAAFPQFSPDGASIVYWVNRAVNHRAACTPECFGVRIVPVTGGKSVLLVDRATPGTLSPDGSTLAMGCERFDGGLCIAHADGTNLRVLVSVSGPPWFGPRWSPDGTRIAYINPENNPADSRVFVVDVATGETTFVAQGDWSEWLDDHTLIIENVGTG
jgi:Tol biopolymer transport system component